MGVLAADGDPFLGVQQAAPLSIEYVDFARSHHLLRSPQLGGQILVESKVFVPGPQLPQHLAGWRGAEQLGHTDQTLAQLALQTALGQLEEHPTAAAHHHHHQDDETEDQLAPDAPAESPPSLGTLLRSHHVHARPALQ